MNKRKNLLNEVVTIPCIPPLCPLPEPPLGLPITEPIKLLLPEEDELGPGVLAEEEEPDLVVQNDPDTKSGMVEVRKEKEGMVVWSFVGLVSLKATKNRSNS